MTTLKWTRIRAGEYETLDGRLRISNHHTSDGWVMFVNGQVEHLGFDEITYATAKDAKFFAEDLAYDWRNDGLIE